MKLRPSNFERMIALAESVFNARRDPEQLDVNDQVLERLSRIHPCSVSEQDDGNGPVAWILLIPTSLDLMDAFISGRIGERELYEQTPEGGCYDALYLCSALVLEEYRRKGVARRLTLDALSRISADHPIKALFVWTFSGEGASAAASLAMFTGLPLYHRRIITRGQST